MRGSLEARRTLNRYRSRAAKQGQKNGGYGWLDDIRLDRLLYNSKRFYQRHLSSKGKKE